MRLLLVDGTNVTVRWARAMLPDDFDDPSDEDANRVLAAVGRVLHEAATVTVSDYAILAFDAGESWRRARYPAYKSHRPPGTGAWSRRACDFLMSEGWYCCQSDGFEADDVVASVATRSINRGHHVSVVSGDSDLLQLAGPTCDLWQFGRSGEPRFVQRSVEWICEKYGCYAPCGIAAYKALVGEPSDGLPGVRGIGPVRAKKLLAGGVIDLDPEQMVTYDLMLSLTKLRIDVPVHDVPAASCRVPGRK